MLINHIGESIELSVKNISFSRFDKNAEYAGIISPVTRIYYIVKGTAYLQIGNNKTVLNAGNCYIIPGFTLCSYFFEKGLEHYYVHFSIEMKTGISVFDYFSFKNEVVALETDINLIQRLLEINPNRQLPHHDPKVYQSKPWINKEYEYSNINHYLETRGIIQILFSRFLSGEVQLSLNNWPSGNIRKTLNYIHKNPGENLSVGKLAEMACMSDDHFSRVFKRITGMPPMEFIIKKRLELAKSLLLTSDYYIVKIAALCGFKTSAYFCRVFKIHIGLTPYQYRQTRE